jgi:voltage-gated potassium channel
MEKKISELENHVVVCGFGRNGKKATLELLDHNEKLVVIENEAKLISRISEIENLLYIEGDATEEDVLKIAQIENAKAIITTLPNDADNLFVVLSSRDLNEKIKIISRASEEHSDYKLRQAGADNIIMPDKLGGQQMAKLITHPDTVEFINFVLLERGKNVKLYEVICEKMDECNIQKSIGEFNFRNKTGANIIGIKTVDGNYIFNPSKDIKLSCDDKIFVLGTYQQVIEMKEILYATND